MDKDKIQYNAALIYLEKRALKIKNIDAKILGFILLIGIYFLGLYVFKLISL